MIDLLQNIWFAGYIPAAVVFYGMQFAYWQKEWILVADETRNRDILWSLAWSIFLAIWWPITFWVVFLETQCAKHGLKYW